MKVTIQKDEEPEQEAEFFAAGTWGWKWRGALFGSALLRSNGGCWPRPLDDGGK